METQHEYLIGVKLTFTSGRTVSETLKVRGLSEDHARVKAYARVKEMHFSEKIDDSMVICLGLCEPA